MIVGPPVRLGTTYHELAQDSILSAAEQRIEGCDPSGEIALILHTTRLPSLEGRGWGRVITTHCYLPQRDIVIYPRYFHPHLHPPPSRGRNPHHPPTASILRYSLRPSFDMLRTRLRMLD
jgi:hypothetical protein